MRRLAAAALVLLAAGCASMPLPEREGIVLYRAKCSGCHRPYAPAERDAATWRKSFPEMAKRAHLTPEQSETILRYLDVEMVPSHRVESGG